MPTDPERMETPVLVVMSGGQRWIIDLDVPFLVDRIAVIVLIRLHDEPVNELFLRIVDNDVTVSLNTSGDPLYRRGWRTEVGKAPMRGNQVGHY